MNAAGPFSVIDPLPATFATQLFHARGRGWVARATKLYDSSAHGAFALDAVQRLIKGEVAIASEVTMLDFSVLRAVRGDVRAAEALRSLRCHAEEPNYR